ncbi:unnamed protein product [Urochloa decumbens]|uniref:CCT domain-containing protein n=1 Tax=Urochloa decumbens TaxID=240449 RepID=A0ABC8Y0I3_9POAL
MLDDDHPFADDISSPIAAHILDFCDDGSGGDLFAAVNVASEMFTASSEDASSSSVTTPPPPCSHGDNVSSGAAASAFSPMPSLDSTLSALLEEDDPAVPDPELLLPIDYQLAAAVAGDEPEQQFGGQVPVPLPAEQPALQTQMSSTASELMQLASSAGYGDEWAMAGGGGYVGLDEALCQQHQPPPPPPPGALLPTGVMDPAAQGCFFGKDAAAAAQGGFFGCAGGMVMPMMGMEEIGEYQRMMESASAALAATHSPDADPAAAAQMAFAGSAAAGEMQMGGGGGGGMSPGRLAAAGGAAEASSLEDTSFKSAKISVEERREKIHRYIKKRNERNFSKKIKYACRKTLADSRPRVRGRFAKNDDYGEPSRAMENHDEYDQIAGLKGEDMLDPDALQAHLSGMNSYMYNHTVESWM